MPPSDPALPVAAAPAPQIVRKSKNSKRRAAVLIAVHVLIAAHAVQFWLQGKTLSPIEPSEGMYTLELGQLNAGFIFLLAAMTATLIFGRYFCGWGCHLVALQDLCGWIMKKLGVRPQPFRSRLLMWVPAAAAFYMFFWPALKRWGTALAGRMGWLAALEQRDLLDLAREIGIFTAPATSFPGFTNHLVTDSFWKTFPGPLWAVLTFATCGFAAVYLLGAKGFCTYACPYGALFGGVDRISPGRIVVSEACEQCGHCTATCTSNVIVHEEVRRYGMVVDPGCMKCMDCVSVCPNDALSFGFAKPSAFKGKPRDERSVKRYNLPLGEELLVFVTWFFATGALRGLYGRFPLLMSIGLGAVTAFMALKLWQVVRRPTVRIQNLKLKVAGKLSASGWIFAAVTVIWFAFTFDGALAQWHGKWADYYLNRTEAGKVEVLGGAFVDREYSAKHHEAAERSFAHFQAADRPWRKSQVEIKLGLAWGYLLQDDREAAESEIRQALQITPRDGSLHDELIEFLASRGRFDDALDAAREKLAAIDVTPMDRLKLAGLLMRAGRSDEASDELARARELAEEREDAAGLAALATSYIVVGEMDTATSLLERAVELEPQDAEGQFRLAGLFVRLGRNEEAIERYRICTELMPEAAEPHFNLGGLLRRMGRNEESIVELERTLELAPEDLVTHIELGFAYMAAERHTDALDTLRRAEELHPESPEVRLQLPPILADLEARVAARTTSPTDPPR